MKRQSNNSVNAAILARVSTRNQEDNSSLDGQIDRCREYCIQCGYTATAERREIMSGSFVLARSVFNELLQLAADGEISVIVVDIPDRLGRGDVIANLELMAKLNNARIEYAQPGRDKTTVEGLVQHSAEQMVSGIERLNIKRRMTGGKYKLAQQGRVIAPPRRPYGYDVVSEYNDRGKKTSCTLVPRPDEAEVVVKMYEWCATECLTVRQIAKQLSELKIPRICETDEAHHKAWDNKKRAKFSSWSRSTVVQILRNPLYRGEWQYGKVKVERIDTLDGIKRHAERRNEGIISVNVPPMVERWLWDAVQEQLAENRRKFYRPPQREYLLRGRVRCALCGGMFIGGCIKRASGKLYIKYVCRRASGEYAYDPNCCHAGVLNGEFAERAVWHAIRDAMLEPDRLWVGVKQRRDEERKARRIITSALAAIERGDIEDNTRLDRLLDLYTSGDIDKERYLAKRSSLKDQIAKRNEEHSALAVRLSEHNVLTDEQIDDLRMFQAEIAGRMSDDVPPADKMRLLDLLRVECVYNSNTKELAITGLMGNTLLSVTSA